MKLWQTHKALLLFAFLTLMRFGDVNSSIELVGKDKTPESGQKKEETDLPKTDIPIDKKPDKSDATVKSPPDNLPLYKDSLDNSLKNQKRRWLELHGSLNRQSVYLMLEKTGKREVAGYLFDGKGKHTYVHGEWFNGHLQIYDQSNKRLTILLHE